MNAIFCFIFSDYHESGVISTVNWGPIPSEDSGEHLYRNRRPGFDGTSLDGEPPSDKSLVPLNLLTPFSRTISSQYPV